MNKFCINIIIINIIFVTIYLLYDIFSNVENSFDKRNYKYLQVVNNTNKSKSYNILIKITLLIIFSLITLVFCNLGLQILSWIPTILLFLTFFMLFNFPLYIYITNSELDENIEEAEEELEEELNDECLNEDYLLEKNRIDRDYVRNQLYNLVINHYDNDEQNFEINEIKLYNDDISCNDDSSYNDISFNDLYDDEKLFVKEYVNNIPFVNKFEMNLNHLIDTFYECCL
tara:strand:+ start:1043 stop:1729 length:687 start_codon:yes stop_codon:yes gene_type:complete